MGQKANPQILFAVQNPTVINKGLLNTSEERTNGEVACQADTT